jgi:hypothetical protein
MFDPVTSLSPARCQRLRCIIVGVAFLFIAFVVQDRAMRATADSSTLTAAYQLRFLADAIAIGAAVLILRGAIPFAVEHLGHGFMQQRETPAEREEPCDSAAQ